MPEYKREHPGGRIDLDFAAGKFAAGKPVKVWLGSKVGDASRGAPEATVNAESGGSAHVTLPGASSPGVAFHVEGQDPYVPDQVKRMVVPIDPHKHRNQWERRLADLKAKGRRPSPAEEEQMKADLKKDLA